MASERVGGLAKMVSGTDSTILTVCLLVLLVADAAHAEDQSNAPVRLKGSAPPVVEATYPSYFFRYFVPDLKMEASDTVDFSSFRVEWSVPVTGIQAEDLTVNGSSAAHVTGSGAGPYIFTGYASPALGLVVVKLAPGRIVRDSEAHPHFEGNSWSFRLFAPEGDDDADGLTNAKEIEFGTDPTKSDTDDDELPDFYEVEHHCLKPFFNEALPHEVYGRIVPGDGDADDDGISNLEEFKRGTDPCAP